MDHSLLATCFCLPVFRYLDRRRRRGARGGSPKRLYKALTDYTKPQQTTQSPDRLNKAPNDYTKPPQSMQRPRILDTDLEYLTGVTTIIDLTYNT